MTANRLSAGKTLVGSVIADREVSVAGVPNIRCLRIPLTDISGTSEIDTGVDLPARSVVLNVFLDVTAAEATATTKTIDVGLKSSESGGDADGFLDGLSTAATGVKKGTLASAGQTLGALLRVDESGAGVLVPEPHMTATAVSVTYTLGEAATELDADIVIVYLDTVNA
jgi:hypothetical protein